MGARARRYRVRFTVAAALLVAVTQAPLWADDSLTGQPADGLANDGTSVRLYYFWGDGCGVCERQSVFLDRIRGEYSELQIERFEVWHDEDNLALLRDVAARMSFEPQGVPVTIVGDRHWIGFSPQIASQIERQVEECIESGCPEPTVSTLPHDGRAHRRDAIVDLPMVGQLDVATQPIILLTVVIAFVDGFNPCSLWVLTMLLVLVVYTRSRLKTIMVGATFLLITAVVYGGFITGVFGIFGFVQHLGWVRALTAIIALVLGILNIKDSVRLGEGISSTISPQHKHGITDRIRDLVRGERSLAAMVAATAVMAIGIALVELPCTAGFPIIWSGIMVERQITGLGFALLLCVYLLVYLVIELGVFFAAVFGLHTPRMTEGYARVLKLLGGVIMLVLAVVLLFFPDAMHDVRSSMIVFASALMLGATVLLGHRIIRGSLR